MCFPARKRKSMPSADDVPIRPAGAEHNTYWREKIASENGSDVVVNQGNDNAKSNGATAGLPNGVKSRSSSSLIPAPQITNSSTASKAPTQLPPPPPPTPYVSTASIKDPSPFIAVSRPTTSGSATAKHRKSSSRTTLKKRESMKEKNNSVGKGMKRDIEGVKDNEQMVAVR